MRRSIFALIVSLAAGCNGAPTGGAGAGADPNGLQLALVGVDNVQLFDATTMSMNSGNQSVASAIVTINEIDAKVDAPGFHDKDVWVPISTTAVTVDLLKLDNKTLNTLGITTLPQGHIEGLRLKLDEIGDYVVLKDGTKKPLEVPDNGIVEVVGKLDLDSCATGIIILDFDPHIRTEHENGQREYELSCVSHIKTEEVQGSCGGGGGGVGPDMANGPDMIISCANGQTCPAGDKCQAGVCVKDLCNGVVCTGMTSCDPNTGNCI
jgi:hypothetical protein